ncbi:MAG: hypothetical protein ACR2G6_07850 [Gemmatimonadaceae bacterium]
MRSLCFLVTFSVLPTLDVGSIGASDPPLAPLFAVASAKLLGAPGGQNVIVLPAAEERRATRARRASGAPHTADAATAREVAGLLVRQGYQGIRMKHSAPARTGAILLILGAVRFEPPSKPTFARLIIEVVGTDGTREAMEFLLKREPGGWRALKMESAEDVS